MPLLLALLIALAAATPPASALPSTPERALPQDTLGVRGAPPDSLIPLRLAAITGTLTAASVGLYLYQKNAWWSEEHRGSFRFHDDRGYSLHLDKVGHVYGTYLQAQVISRALRWSGLSPNASALGGSLGAFALQLNVEINDGFNELWGFDPKDVMANAVGAGFFYVRDRWPALQPIVLKMSYWPSELVTSPSPREGGAADQPTYIIDDYMGHTYWVSLRVADLLPEPAREFWPSWLAVAAGVSGDRMYTPEARIATYLSLDVDLERVLPAQTWLGAQGREALSFLRLPAPAIRLSPRPMLYLVYYGQQ